MWIYFVINSSLAIGIGDPVASVGRLTFSITDRRNSSLRKKTLRYVSVRHHRSVKEKDRLPTEVIGSPIPITADELVTE